MASHGVTIRLQPSRGLESVQHVTQRVELESLEQGSQPRLGGVEVVVVVDPNPAADRLPGLLRVDLLGMNVENRGPTGGLQARQPPAE